MTIRQGASGHVCIVRLIQQQLARVIDDGVARRAHQLRHAKVDDFGPLRHFAQDEHWPAQRSRFFLNTA